MIYRFRVILDNDTDDDIFRDIEIHKTNSLEEFHKTIINSFSFINNEMASFYISDNEWNQGEEISLFNFGDESKETKLMSSVAINQVINNQNNKLIYIYDFLNMWVFLIELIEVAEEIKGVNYPNIIFSKGKLPEKAPEKKFESKKDGIVDDGDYEDDHYY
ncbi:MAG: IS1096 element passenger TnpR family protein [Flavobacteriaceae bacterium]